MEDVLALFGNLTVTIGGFSEADFGIFNVDERDALKTMWRSTVKRDPVQFMRLLSPDQRNEVTKWALKECSFSTVMLAEAADALAAYLKKLPDYTFGAGTRLPIIPTTDTPLKKKRTNPFFKTRLVPVKK